MQDAGHVGGYLMEREADWPADFAALQKASFQGAARHYLERADKSSGAERARLLEVAETCAKNASDDALLAQVARRRGKAK